MNATSVLSILCAISIAECSEEQLVASSVGISFWPFEDSSQEQGAA